LLWNPRWSTLQHRHITISALPTSDTAPIILTLILITVVIGIHTADLLGDWAGVSIGDGTVATPTTVMVIVTPGMAMTMMATVMTMMVTAMVLMGIPVAVVMMGTWQGLQQDTPQGGPLLGQVARQDQAVQARERLLGNRHHDRLTWQTQAVQVELQWQGVRLLDPPPP
jgi:hypothetical protein